MDLIFILSILTKSRKLCIKNDAASSAYERTYSSQTLWMLHGDLQEKKLVLLNTITLFLTGLENSIIFNRNGNNRTNFFAVWNNAYKQRLAQIKLIFAFSSIS